MTVVAAFELDHDVPAGGGAGETQQRCGRFGARVHHPHHVDRWDDLTDQLGQFDLSRGRHPERAAFPHRFDDGEVLVRTMFGPDPTDLRVANSWRALEAMQHVPVPGLDGETTSFGIAVDP